MRKLQKTKESLVQVFHQQQQQTIESEIVFGKHQKHNGDGRSYKHTGVFVSTSKCLFFFDWIVDFIHFSHLLGDK